MSKPIIFIHGMFQNARSWEKWASFFSDRGYSCIAKSWPYHEGNPSELRINPPEALGGLRLQTVINQYANIVAQHPDAILIGHSVGGLIVQSLINRGYGSAGVCIASVAPNRMLTLDWSFFKNAAAIANPLKGDDPIFMTATMFHQNFANTLSSESALIEYQRTAVHDSRYMLRDCLTEDGHIDLDKPHAPLLFISAELDQIIPPHLNEKNAKAYSDKHSSVDYRKFDNRGHYICGEPGWEHVARYVANWISSKVPALDFVQPPETTTPEVFIP
jgi:pimeloyl-ACP methyl ester carboxylesterase